MALSAVPLTAIVSARPLDSDVHVRTRSASAVSTVGSSTFSPGLVEGRRERDGGVGWGELGLVLLVGRQGVGGLPGLELFGEVEDLGLVFELSGEVFAAEDAFVGGEGGVGATGVVGGELVPGVGAGGHLVEGAEGHPAGALDQHLRRPLAGGLEGQAVLGVAGGGPELEAALDGGLGPVPEADQLVPARRRRPGGRRVGSARRGRPGRRPGRASSHQRPGVAVAGRVVGEGPGLQQGARPGQHGVALEGVEQVGQLAGEAAGSTSVCRSAARSSGRRSPAKSQITVRTLNSWWKLRPLSMAQMWPSPSTRQWPPLRSVDVGHEVEGAQVAEGVVVALVLPQGEVVLAEVGVDELLHASPRPSARPASPSAAPAPSPGPSTARRRRPPAGTARTGSPTAGARPARACRRRASSTPSSSSRTRNVPLELYGIRPSIVISPSRRRVRSRAALNDGRCCGGTRAPRGPWVRRRSGRAGRPDAISSSACRQ